MKILNLIEFGDYYLVNVIIVCIIICLLMMVLNLFMWLLNKYILPIRIYLTDITSYTMADLKKPHAILYRQVLIKNLYVMRTIVKWAVLIMSIGITLCLGFITYQNKEYFQEYFEAKQQKLNLASEEKVTEMLQTIEAQKIYLDSVLYETTISIDSLSSVINKMQLENAKLIERNRNQTYMIDNLNKIISTHGMQSKKIN